MELSVIIVNWNTCELLAACLTSVYETLQGIEFETIVVDNASQDGSPAMVRSRFPQARLVKNGENVGFARANNQAIRKSDGRFVLLLNSDARLKPGTIQHLLAAMHQHERAGIVGPALEYADGSPQISYGRLPTLASEIASLFGLDKLLTRAAWGVRRQFGGRQFGGQRSTNGAQPASKPIETGLVSGACLLARRAMLDQIGLLDTGFFMFSEEIDLCFRAHQASWSVLHVPTAQAIHIGGGSTGHTASRLLMLYRGKLRYFAKNHGARSRGSLYRAIRLATLLKIAAYTLLSRFKPHHTQNAALWREVYSGTPRLSA